MTAAKPKPILRTAILSRLIDTVAGPVVLPGLPRFIKRSLDLQPVLMSFFTPSLLGQSSTTLNCRSNGFRTSTDILHQSPFFNGFC